MTTLEEKRKLLKELMEETDNQTGWDKAWKQGLTPWEMTFGNVAQPTLRWACESGADEAFKQIPRTGRALVPGCGRGQDVAYFAMRGLDATGVEISEAAVEAAQTWLNEQGEKLQSEQIRRHAHVLKCDYFDLQNGPGVHPAMSNVDLAYDYTFFCAIPPELRVKWADAYAAAVGSGGVLICVAYPLNPTQQDDDHHGASPSGPPFTVSTQLYTSLLQDKFDLLFDGIPDNLSANKVGRERLMIWQRK